MEKELIISANAGDVEIALLEDGKLVELHNQKTDSEFLVGDVFLGRVKRLMPGLNAGFVDIGHPKDAFLHYTDLGPKVRSLMKYCNSSFTGGNTTHRLDQFKYEPEIVKTGKIDQVLSKKQLLLVQILKEPISTKGPRLTCDINLPGRYLVLTPFSEGVSVSKKIASSEERKRLQTLVESIKPKNFSAIVRTAAEGKKAMDIHEEMTDMMNRWEQIFSQLKNANPPVKLLSELDKTSSIIRDFLSDSFSNVVVNDKQVYGQIKTYLQSYAPEQEKILSHYKGTKPIFDQYGVTRQIKSAFGKTASMPSGAYLVIEHTEAMHVIDVNSGHKMGASQQDDTALKVNLEAAEEIARQLRLRDIGGLITIDFIDMKSNEHRKELHKAMRDFMKPDRAQHTILPLSKFGLMQITRERVRPEVKINTAEVCPTCNGSGKTNASILVLDNIERDLETIMQAKPSFKLKLVAHPFVAAHLKQGLFNKTWEWFRKYQKWVSIQPNNDYSLHTYRFFDANEEEIRMS